MGSYHNLGQLKSATTPIAPTGAGAIWPSQTDDKMTMSDYSLFFWARATARSFFVRAISTFLYATGVLAFLAFLATINGTDTTKMYVTALSVVINAVAVMHYRWIGKIRSYMGPHWLISDRFKGQSRGPWLPFNKWNPNTAVGVEIMVDGLRHSDWLVRIIAHHSNIRPLYATSTLAFTPTHLGNVLGLHTGATFCFHGGRKLSLSLSRFRRSRWSS